MFFIAFTIEKHTVSVLFFKSASNNKTYSHVEPNSKVNRRRRSLLRQASETFKVNLLESEIHPQVIFPLCLNSNYSVTIGFTSFQKWRILLPPPPRAQHSKDTEHRKDKHVNTFHKRGTSRNCDFQLINTYGLANCLHRGFPKVRFLEMWGSRGDSFKPWL